MFSLSFSKTQILPFDKIWWYSPILSIIIMIARFVAWLMTMDDMLLLLLVMSFNFVCESVIEKSKAKKKFNSACNVSMKLNFFSLFLAGDWHGDRDIARYYNTAILIKPFRFFFCYSHICTCQQDLIIRTSRPYEFSTPFMRSQKRSLWFTIY